MGVRYLVSAAVLLVSICAGLPALADSPEERGQFASGSFLIAVQGDAARALQNKAARGKGSKALDIAPPLGNVDDDQRATPEPAYQVWISTPAQRVEGEAGPTNGAMWDRAHAFIDKPGELLGLGFDGQEMEQITRAGALYTIEPDIAIWDPQKEEGYSRLRDSPEANADEAARRSTHRTPDALVASLVSSPRTNNFVLVKPVSPAWPPPKGASLLWHFDSNHSDLTRARLNVQNQFDMEDGSRNVLVFHLDTGYFGMINAATPRFLDARRSISFLEKDGYSHGSTPPRGYDRFDGGRLGNDGHGVATLSILAGDVIAYKPTPSSDRVEFFLGGAPFARVISCRIGDSVVHFRTKTMGQALEYAVRQGADLITMAAGGPPSEYLQKAINEAYDHGVPMVFAAGDYFVVAPVGGLLTPFSRTPHTTVYPARFSRSLAVTGATADRGNYADGTITGFFSDRGVWSMRGSYGPGEVLMHTLAAYTPNVTAHQADGGYSNHITAQFAGTSAATPQVAAAAALWLQKYRDDPIVRKKNWRRAEAVYEALFESARMRAPEARPHPFFGRGILDAYAAMSIRPGDLHLEWRPPSKADHDWLRGAGILIDLTKTASAADDEIRPGTAAAHNRMLAVEVAQLYHGSNLLQVLLGPAPERASSGQQEQFLRALLQDSRISVFLRKRVEQHFNREQ